MIVAYNTISFKKSRTEADDFIFELMLKVAMQQPQHTFIFISDTNFNTSSKNLIPLIISSMPKNNLLWMYWYNYKLPAAIKKYKADILVSIDAISLRAKVPQCLIMPDISSLRQRSFSPKKEYNFLKKHLFKFLNKANKIVTLTQTSKKEIVEKYKIEAGKINVINAAADEIFKAIEFTERESAKEKYADGNEYFLCSAAGATNNFINLLKAFSLFKKRQKSSMQLIILTQNKEAHISFTENLRLYKFKEDVKLVIPITKSDFVEINAAAYAFIHPVKFDTTGISLLQALQCEVPIITSDISNIKEIFGESALYTESDMHENIAEKLMLIFKDEKLRSNLIVKGKERMKNYTWNNATTSLWKSIEKAVN